MAQYVRSSHAPAVRARQSQKTKKVAVANKRAKSIAFKRVILIVAVFLLALVFTNQYSRIISVSSQINSLENEIKQTDSLIDITEGKVLSTINWDEIESVAKNKLHMVSPDKNDYTIIQLKELPKDFEIVQASIGDEKNETDESKLSLLINFLSN